MEFTAKQIAQFVQGVIEGDENASVTTFTKIEEGVPGAISLPIPNIHIISMKPSLRWCSLTKA